MKNRLCVWITFKRFIISIKYKFVIVSTTYDICYWKAVIQVKNGAEIKFFPSIGDLEFGDIRSAIDNYMKFYAEERPQERFRCQTPLEVRWEALSAEKPIQYPIAENKRIEAYKAK